MLDLAARKFADISYHYKKEHVFKNDYLYSKELIPDKYKIFNDIIKINSLDPLTTISSHPNTKKETLEYILSIYPSDNYLAYASIIEQRKDEEWKISIIDWPPPKRLINNPSNKYVQEGFINYTEKKINSNYSNKISFNDYLTLMMSKKCMKHYHSKKNWKIDIKTQMLIDWRLRAAMALNHDISKSLRSKLKNDGNIIVRHFAKEYKSY